MPLVSEFVMHLEGFLSQTICHLVLKNSKEKSI